VTPSSDVIKIVRMPTAGFRCAVEAQRRAALRHTIVAQTTGSSRSAEAARARNLAVVDSQGRAQEGRRQRRRSVPKITATQVDDAGRVRGPVAYDRQEKGFGTVDD